MNISYSFGMVDLLHFGHITALRKASLDSDLSIFGLVSDEASNAWFGTHVSNEKERREVLESIKYIDEVWIQETFDPIDNLRKLHKKYPDAVISLYTGNEWGIISGKRYVESIGGRIIKLDYYDKLSPQAILDTLNRNENSDRPLVNNLISTKANTLQTLKEVITKSRIEDIYIVYVGEFNNNSERVLKSIRDYYGSGEIVVRSSSKREDAFEESNAGHFTSVLGVDVSDVNAVRHAISAVISSYGKDMEDDEQVLIQRQTKNVLVSGVVFTRDIQRNRPYYVINYDESGRTDSVTSGSTGASAWLSYLITEESVPSKWRELMEAVWEIEDIIPGILLDIEFAITPYDVVIFQVRPLAAAYKFGRKDNRSIVEKIEKDAVILYNKHSKVGLTCFSDMAFWNPAEIIGDNPRNLDFSLYREIITKSAWNKGIVPLGYRDVNKELMFRFGNKPYINVERSFEALIPGELSEELTNKLCNYYVNKLKKDVSSHDKIEFEISHNCYDFSMHSRLGKLMMDGFSTEEVLALENALKSMTIRTISTYKEILAEDILDLKRLEGVRLDIQNITNSSRDFRLIAKSIHILLDAIENFGTPQFSRHARCAFIAKSLCESLVREKYITNDQYNQFVSSIHTVAVDYDRDYHSVIEGKMSRDQFDQIYGHLRAGTYNIRSPRYDQMKEMFFNILPQTTRVNHSSNCCNGIVVEAFNNAIEDAGFDGIKGEVIVEFIREATKQREFFKFIFTKSLSLALELIRNIGEIAGIETRDISYLELPEIYATEYYSDLDRLHEFWSLIIDKRREIYRINSEMIMPEVIFSERDFIYVENVSSRPNFITEGIINGEVVLLEEDISKAIDGKIVVIEKADPGYDWIFSKGIAGLVTKYGGAASHMAIRCAEFMIPAAIGCGTKLYEYAAESTRLTIDCKHERLVRESG